MMKSIAQIVNTHGIDRVIAAAPWRKGVTAHQPREMLKHKKSGDIFIIESETDKGKGKSKKAKAKKAAIAKATKAKTAKENALAKIFKLSSAASKCSNEVAILSHISGSELAKMFKLSVAASKHSHEVVKLISSIQ